jgi:hypothetical protein
MRRDWLEYRFVLPVVTPVSLHERMGPSVCLPKCRFERVEASSIAVLREPLCFVQNGRVRIRDANFTRRTYIIAKAILCQVDLPISCDPIEKLMR